MRFYVWFLALHITLFYHKKNIFLVLKKEYRPAFYLDAIKKECRHAFWGHRLGQAPLSGPKKGLMGRVYHEKELIGEVEVDSVQKEKMDVNELVAGETGGIAFKLEKKLVIEVNDRVKFFTRELVKKKL